MCCALPCREGGVAGYFRPDVATYRDIATLGIADNPARNTLRLRPSCSSKQRRSKDDGRGGPGPDYRLLHGSYVSIPCDVRPWATPSIITAIHSTRESTRSRFAIIVG